MKRPTDSPPFSLRFSTVNTLSLPDVHRRVVQRGYVAFHQWRVAAEIIPRHGRIPSMSRHDIAAKYADAESMLRHIVPLRSALPRRPCVDEEQTGSYPNAPKTSLRCSSMASTISALYSSRFYHSSMFNINASTPTPTAAPAASPATVPSGPATVPAVPPMALPIALAPSLLPI